MSTKKFDLTILEIDEISLCHDGDNKPAKVVLAKSNPSGEDMNTPDPANCTHEKGRNGKCKHCGMMMSKASSKTTGREPGTLPAKSTNKGANMGKKNQGDAPEMEGLPDDVVEYIKSLEEQIDVLKSDPDEGDEDDGSDDLVAKALAKASPEIAEAVAKAMGAMTEKVANAQADADEARRAAEAERQVRVKSEMLAKARSLPNISGTPEEKAQTLMDAYAVSEEFGKKIEQALKAADAQVAAGGDNLFRPMGKSTGEGTVTDEVMSKAKALMAADSSVKTLEQAMVKVYEQEPGLYDRLVKEA